VPFSGILTKIDKFLSLTAFFRSASAKKRTARDDWRGSTPLLLKKRYCPKFRTITVFPAGGGMGFLAGEGAYPRISGHRRNEHL